MKLDNDMYEKPSHSFWDNINIDHKVNKVIYSQLRAKVIINKHVIIKEIYSVLKKNFK